MIQGKKNRKFFWVPSFAPLVSVILSTFFVYITHAEKKGVQIVRISRTDLDLKPDCIHSDRWIISQVKILQVNHIEKGINPPSVKEIYFTGDYLLKGVRIGIVAGMIALTVRLHLVLQSSCLIVLPQAFAWSTLIVNEPNRKPLQLEGLLPQ